MERLQRLFESVLRKRSVLRKNRFLTSDNTYHIFFFPEIIQSIPYSELLTISFPIVVCRDQTIIWLGLGSSRALIDVWLMHDNALIHRRTEVCTFPRIVLCPLIYDLQIVSSLTKECKSKFLKFERSTRKAVQITILSEWLKKMAISERSHSIGLTKNCCSWNLNFQVLIGRPNSDPFDVGPKMMSSFASQKFFITYTHFVTKPSHGTVNSQRATYVPAYWRDHRRSRNSLIQFRVVRVSCHRIVRWSENFFCRNIFCIHWSEI